MCQIAPPSRRQGPSAQRQSRSATWYSVPATGSPSLRTAVVLLLGGTGDIGRRVSPDDQHVCDMAGGVLRGFQPQQIGGLDVRSASSGFMPRRPCGPARGRCCRGDCTACRYRHPSRSAAGLVYMATVRGSWPRRAWPVPSRQRARPPDAAGSVQARPASAPDRCRSAAATASCLSTVPCRSGPRPRGVEDARGADGVGGARPALGLGDAGGQRLDGVLRVLDVAAGMQHRAGGHQLDAVAATGPARGRP